MKILNKLLITPIVAMAVACNSSAPSEDVETKEAQEVKEAKKTQASKTFTVNTGGDEIMWEGFKTYADGSHHGTLQVSKGSFDVKGEKLVGGSFVIDMTTIHSEDLADDKENYNKLVGHLKSPDFFAVDSFSTAKFEITEVKKATDDTTGATHHVSGNLTMRGITKNITIPAKVDASQSGVSFSTPEFVIDRSKWNVRFRSTSFTEFADVAKEKAIDNNIRLKVRLKAQGQA